MPLAALALPFLAPTLAPLMALARRAPPASAPDPVEYLQPTIPTPMQQQFWPGVIGAAAPAIWEMGKKVFEDDDGVDDDYDDYDDYDDGDQFEEEDP